MKLSHIPSTIAAALFCTAQCLCESKPILVDHTVAEVGGRRITLSDAMAEVRDRLFEERIVPSESAVAAFYPEAVSNLVARQLILLEYEQGDAKIPDWYFNQRIESIVENNFGGDKSRLVALLKERGISYPEWRRRRNEDAIVGTMRQQFVEQGVAARPSDIERVYRESYATNTLPGRIKVSMIALKQDDAAPGAAEKLAAEILGKLASGGSFSALARLHSQENHAKDGGSWGYLEPADEFRKELAEAIEALPVGKVSEPVEAGGFIYLLKKDDERADLSVPLEIVRGEIEENLLKEAAEKRFAEWIKHLSNKHTVRIFPAQ